MKKVIFCLAALVFTQSLTFGADEIFKDIDAIKTAGEVYDKAWSVSDINYVPANGTYYRYTPLGYALQYKYSIPETALRLIKDGANVNAPTKAMLYREISPIALAVSMPESTDIRVVNALIAKGVNKNDLSRAVIEVANNARGAGVKQSSEFIKTLAAAGANLNDAQETVYSKGYTPLLIVCSRLPGILSQITQLLIDLGADVNFATTISGTTALMLACQKMLDEGLPSVKILLERGANVNIQNKDGQTALMMAAKNSNKKIIITLLNAGANAAITDKNNKTANDHWNSASIYKRNDDITSFK